MILKSLYFDLNRQEYANQYGYELLLASRFYCNFIERLVFKPLKWKTENFNRIVIEFTDNPIRFMEINSSQVLCVRIKFDKEKYEEFKNEKIAEFFITHLENVVECIQKGGIELPIKEIYECNQFFRSEEYINKWLYQKKISKTLKLDIFLFCELNKKQFELTLEVYKNKMPIYIKSILTTDPDPIAYHYRFKDIVLTDKLITITSKISKENLIQIYMDDNKTAANN